MPVASFEEKALFHHVAFNGLSGAASNAFKLLKSRISDSDWRIADEAHDINYLTFSGQLEIDTSRGQRATVTIAPAANYHSSAAPEYLASVNIKYEQGGGGEADLAARRWLFSLIDQIPLTQYELAEIRRQFPITQEFARAIGCSALKDVAMFLAIHHMTDFVAMMDALVAMGINSDNVTILDKGYPYTMRYRVDAWLRQVLGLHVYTYPQRSKAVAAHLARTKALGIKTLIIDDGGHVLPIVLREYPDDANQFIGVVEQTVSGIWKLEGLELPIPVFSVAESQLKATVESYGVATAAVNSALRLIDHEKIEGQSALVIGYGRIGRQVAHVLRSRRMQVAVHDRDLVALVAAHEEGFRTGRSLGALIESEMPLLIMGTAGRNSLGAQHLSHFQRSAYLASVTSRTYEFNQAELREASKRVVDHGLLGHSYMLEGDIELCLLGHGMPINFYHAESLPNRYIDLVLSSMLLGASVLAQEDQGGFRSGHNVDLTNKVLNSSSALETYYDWYGPASARRQLLSPRLEEMGREYYMPPWTFETHSTADGAA